MDADDSKILATNLQRYELEAQALGSAVAGFKMVYEIMERQQMLVQQMKNDLHVASAKLSSLESAAGRIDGREARQ